MLTSYSDHFCCGNNLTGYKYDFFLRNGWPGFLDDFPLKASVQIYFQLDGTPQNYTCLVREYVH